MKATAYTILPSAAKRFGAGALALTFLFAAPRSVSIAEAACNLIPVAKKGYPSALGSVDSPITAPGKIVNIRLGACDASAGFEETPASNNA